MTLEQLIQLYRAQSLDSQMPFLCDDVLLTIYANEAQVEACRRGQLLVSTSVTQVEAAAEDLPLPPNAICTIRQARVAGEPVVEVNADAMDALYPGWQDDANLGQPRFLVSGINTGKLNLWPRPNANMPVRLTVQRLPAKHLYSSGDTPEIRQELHPALVEWMLYRAYSRTDSDLADPQKAMVALANFEAEFGRKVSGRNETWVRQGLGVMPGPIA